MLMMAVAALCMLTGCNARKRNTAAARQYTAFITRYIIFNHLIRADFSKLNKSVSLNNNKLLILSIVPMLSLCDAGL